MKTDEEIVFEYHYQNQLKQYEKVKTALDNRDFNYLRTDGHPYVDIKEKNTIIKETGIIDLIQKLMNINNEQAPNESPIFVSSEIKYSEEFINGVAQSYTEEGQIVASSKIYQLPPVEKCHKIATTYTKTDIWKLKYQSEGRDAKKMRELIERIRLTDEV